MGKRNRERIEKIMSGLEKPFRSIGSSLSTMKRAVEGDPVAIDNLSNAVARREGLIGKVTVGKVAKACKIMEGLIRVRGTGDSRRQVLTHLPTEIKQVIEQGIEPFKFYWGILEFRSVWGKLGFDEETLRSMIDDVKKKEK